MKEHAILITAYKNYHYLEEMVKQLTDDFDIFIHVDKKSIEIKDLEINNLRKLGCKILNKYNICWGGINHLYAIIDLLTMSSCTNIYKYYHVISGEDLVVKKYSDFFTMFLNNNKIYISMNDAVKDSNLNKRYKYYHVFVNKDYRIRPYKQLDSFLTNIQRILKIRRNKIGNERNIYKGYVYGSLPHEAVQYILEYIKKEPIFLKDLKYCMIPEEFFFQTILGNSYMADRIANDCKRYSVWEYKHGSIPGYVDENDIKRIEQGNYLFARKVNYEYSSKLIERFKSRYKIIEDEVANEIIEEIN